MDTVLTVLEVTVIVKLLLAAISVAEVPDNTIPIEECLPFY